MSKFLWDPRGTRDVQESDRCGVATQQYSVSFCIQDQWQDIPAEFWAWTFVVRDQYYSAPAQISGPVPDGVGLWVPKLLPSANGTPLWNQIDREPLSSRPRSSFRDRRRPAARGRKTELPAELFKYICNYADGQSAPFRLVNRYWKRQCSHLVFPQISLKHSPQRICQLLEYKRDPSCLFAPHVKSFRRSTVPEHTNKAAFPFLHLLAQTDIPVDEPVIVRGPFRKGHPTVHSIHFDVPKTLPPSCSHGIKHVHLYSIHFERFEHLSRLVSGLPDLETLRCNSICFGSLLAQPTLRRPRQNRNKLKKVELEDTLIGPKREPMSVCGPLYNLFLSVYDRASFFNEGEIDVIVSLLKLMHFDISNQSAEYQYDPDSGSHLFAIYTSTLLCAIRTRPDSSSSIYLNAEFWNAEEVGWGTFHTACGHLPYPPCFVVGARDHHVILGLAANLMKNMPTLFTDPSQALDPSIHDSWFTLIAKPDAIRKYEKMHQSIILPVSIPSHHQPTRASKLVWNPIQTREVENLNEYGVTIQQRTVLFWIENKWRATPANYWAWTFVVREQKYGIEPISFRWDGDRVNGLSVWVPKLLPCGNDSTLWNQIDEQALPSRPTPSYTNRRWRGGTDLPPELFRHICQASDGQSTSFRLVCRYWEQQCRPLIFAQITLRGSPQRVRDLWATRKGPACRIMPHVKSITGIPAFSSESSFPFLHLLGQRGIPVDETIVVKGPIGHGHPTIRSIHFDLPHSRRRFSRGIRSLSLEAIHFRRYEDLMRLVCELPDLEELSCGSGWTSIAVTVTFGSYPTEHLPQRPRRSCNNLKHVRFRRTSAEDDKELPPGYRRFALYPFLAVYDPASFFDDDEVAVICALLQDVLCKKLDDLRLDGCYKYDAKTNSRLFQSDFAFRTGPDSTIIYYNTKESNADVVGWSQVAAACRSLSWPPEFVIGAGDRRDLLDFNANIVEKMPLLFRPGTVKYSLKHGRKWFLTSLDSDKLKGEGKQGLTDVYP